MKKPSKLSKGVKIYYSIFFTLVLAYFIINLLIEPEFIHVSPYPLLMFGGLFYAIELTRGFINEIFGKGKDKKL